MNANDIENLLTRAYEQELTEYAQALEQARAMAAALAEGRNTEAELVRLSASFDTVARLEENVTSLKQLWKEAGRPPGLELQEVLRRLTQTIEELSGVVRSLEQQAEAHKARLTPELDELLRVRQMQQAYGRGR